MALSAGTRLGPYEILEPLGAGGMGEVYRARDTKLGRDVAVKVLPADSLGDESARRHFRTEAETLVRLSHPHIATIHDFDTADGTDFLVMELVRGHSVQDELQAKDTLPEKTVIRLGSSGDGRRLLAAASARGPANRATLMRFNRQAKLFEPALGGESAFYAEPSPDGQWLAWVRYPEGTLWRSRPDGSERLQLTSPPAEAHLPRWSPDGGRIVFASRMPGWSSGTEIRIVAADGSEGELVA